MVETIEKFYIGLLGIGILYVVLKNSNGAGTIVREVGQDIGGLTKTASGGQQPTFGYSVGF